MHQQLMCIIMFFIDYFALSLWIEYWNSMYLMNQLVEKHFEKKNRIRKKKLIEKYEKNTALHVTLVYVYSLPRKSRICSVIHVSLTLSLVISYCCNDKFHSISVSMIRMQPRYLVLSNNSEYIHYIHKIYICMWRTNIHIY